MNTEAQTKPAKIVPKFRFRLNQSWNGSNRGDIIEVGPGLLDALQRGNRGDVIADNPTAPGAAHELADTKMARAGHIQNKAVQE